MAQEDSQKPSEEWTERKFLHDISSPLGTALFLSDALAESLLPGSSLTADDVDQIKTIASEMERVRVMIQKRRDYLIQIGVPASK